MTAQLKGLARLLSGFHEIDPVSVFYLWPGDLPCQFHQFLSVSWVKSGWLSLSSLLKIWASNLHPTSHGALLVRNNPWDTPTGRTNCHTSDLTRLLLRELKTRLDTSLPCIEDESCLIARHFLCLWDTRPWFLFLLIGKCCVPRFSML